MNNKPGYHEPLRELAMIHQGFIRDKARLELGQARTSALDPKTAALIVVGAVVAIGASSTCLQWSASRALAAAASAEEISEVLLAIASVAGLGRVVGAAPDLAAGLGYDVEAALSEIDDPLAALEIFQRIGAAEAPDLRAELDALTRPPLAQ